MVRGSRHRLAAWLGTAAALGVAACQNGGSAPTRGFASPQLVSTRRPTLQLIGYAGDGTVYYTTDGSPADGRTFWSVDTTDGRLQNLGPKLPDPPPPDPSLRRLDCKLDISGSNEALVVTDSLTGVAT